MRRRGRDYLRFSLLCPFVVGRASRRRTFWIGDIPTACDRAIAPRHLTGRSHTPCSEHRSAKGRKGYNFPGRSNGGSSRALPGSPDGRVAAPLRGTLGLVTICQENALTRCTDLMERHLLSGLGGIDQTRTKWTI